MIALYEDAILAFALDPTLQMYTLDTGQSTQTARRQDLDQIQASLDTMYNRLYMLQALVSGDGPMTVQPGW